MSRADVESMIGSGQLRQTLSRHGDWSDRDIQYLIDTFYDGLELKALKRAIKAAKNGLDRVKAVLDKV